MLIERVERSGRQVAVIDIERYADLLAVRAIPEYQFVGDSTVEADWGLLADAGLAPPEERTVIGATAAHLFDYQAWIVDMAVRRERFAVFSMTGTGKTAILLDWCRLVGDQHHGRTLIVSPLNVVGQTIGEASRFYGDSLPVADLRDRADLDRWLTTGVGVGITNYEKIEGVESALPVDAVVLDESSMLKQSMGARRTAMMKAFRGLRWKLCCSATPAPNDRVEYAEHAFFLDQVRSTREFLAAWFVNRDGDWQLKGHAETAFYRHLAAWSVFMRQPAAFGFEDHSSEMPPLEVLYPAVDLTVEQQEHARGHEKGTQSSLFGVQVGGVVSRTKVMQIAHGFVYDGGKVADRFPSHKPVFIADLVNDRHPDEQVIVWVTFDEEGDQLARLIPGAVHLSGKTARVVRDATIEEFRVGRGPRVLLLKPSMFGYGLNLQSCHVQVFSSITDSFERFFQAVRRSHRYGQTEPVTVYVPLTGLDEPMCQNVMSKQATWEFDAARQEQAYVDILRPRDTTERRTFVTEPQPIIGETRTDRWTMIHADSIAHMPTMERHSMDMAVFSPPFANLFTYSSAAADMGNVHSDTEYRLQWKFFAEELLGVMKPGRVVAVHVMDIIRFAGQHGVRHTYDYPSDVRAGMEDAGFLYRARISVDKDPQVQAVRTKDANLLFVTLKRNALDSHPQAAEFVLVFTAPGEAETPVHADDVTNREWIEWAHHIWRGIRETDVLNAAIAKENNDDRHICPLQLPLIERCVRLWSNQGETVFSPFAGIGSEGWESLAWNRRFYGVELKESYYRTACDFLAKRERELDQRLIVTDDRPVEDAVAL